MRKFILKRVGEELSQSKGAANADLAMAMAQLHKVEQDKDLNLKRNEFEAIEQQERLTASLINAL